MSTEQIVSANDLRSEAKEFGRDKNHRVKWAHGHAFGPGRREEEGRPRPARRRRDDACCSDKPGPRPGGKARGALRDDINSASDSSADEEIDEPSTAPAPDAEIAYSYDAERGPSHGSQILGIALAKAVERYEVRQTDKLIKEEYEVLDVAREAPSPGPRTSKKGVAPEDEDYEFIEA